MIEPDFEEVFGVDWLEVLINEDEAFCLELPGVPKDLELREAVFERVLAFGCGPFGKLAGSTRFFAGG